MKLLTWNVQWCCGLDGRIDLARIVDTARALGDFDVLCLQEVAVNQPQLRGDASHDQPALLAALLPGYEICYGAAVDERAADGQGRQRFGNLIASRLPVLQLQHHALPWPADPRVPSMPRMASVATVQAPWGPLRVMTTHLEYYSARQRAAQAQALRDLHAQACARAAAPPLDEEEDGPFRAKPHTTDCVLTGDFNCRPDSDEYCGLTADRGDGTHFVDSWRALRGAQPHAPTFRVHDGTEGSEPACVDFVLASATLAPRLRRVAVDGATRASDHQPVWVELQP